MLVTKDLVKHCSCAHEVCSRKTEGRYHSRTGNDVVLRNLGNNKWVIRRFGSKSGQLGTHTWLLGLVAMLVP